MIAGQRHQAATGVLTIDYADVLRQAVANERARVLQNLRTRVNNLETTKASSRNSWDTDPRTAADFKVGVLRAISDEEERA